MTTVRAVSHRQLRDNRRPRRNGRPCRSWNYLNVEAACSSSKRRPRRSGRRGRFYADPCAAPDRAASKTSRRDSCAAATLPAFRPPRIICSRAQCLPSRILFQERGVLCGRRHLCSYRSLRHFAILESKTFAATLWNQKYHLRRRYCPASSTRWLKISEPAMSRPTALFLPKQLSQDKSFPNNPVLLPGFSLLKLLSKCLISGSA